MMRSKSHPPLGARPGTLAIAADAPPPKIRLVRYDQDSITAADVTDVSELEDCPTTDKVSWIDVQGFGDEAVLHRLAACFSIHLLALEDVVNVPVRPKAELYDDHLLIITRMVRPMEDGILVEQVGLVLGERFLLTFQEHDGDVFDPVRARLRSPKGIARRSGPDYLAYALIDALIDAYFPLVEELSAELEELEEEVLGQPGPDVLRSLHRIKRELLALRRALLPQREAVNSLIRDPDNFVGESAAVFLRDVYDHCVQIVEAIDAAREMASSLLNLYLSVIGQRTNEVMKVLTIVASIFVPLTFMAGIYGMNFESMPELAAPWGYPALLVAMALVTTAMLFFFRRKGWLGNPRWEATTDDGGTGEDNKIVK